MYSAKGHFKATDMRRNLVTATIWLCAITSVVGLVGINPMVDRAMSAIGLFGAIALLIWNEGEGKEFKARHKEVGEKYLALHKEIRNCYFLSDCETAEVEKLTQQVIALDKSDKPDITIMARKWAQRGIEKNDETDNWWLKKKGK